MDTTNEIVDVNDLPEVDKVPAGKKMFFTDSTDNSGGTISFEKMRAQIADNATDPIARAQIANLNNLPEGATTGDAELQDIRTGEDGTIYSSAGEAVRGQVKKLKEESLQLDTNLTDPNKAAPADVVGSLKETLTATNEALTAETARATAVEATKADKVSLVKTARSLDALWKLNQGISYQFEEDDTVAYQKDVPSGAKLVSVEKLGGRTLVWNQLIFSAKSDNFNGIKISTDESGVISCVGTAINQAVIVISNNFANASAHKFYCGVSGSTNEGWYVAQDGGLFSFKGDGAAIKTIADSKKPVYLLIEKGTTVDFSLRPQLFDLTAMFGSGNEPSTPEEFESMFPADYYPYDAGSLMSARVNEVVEQGKNLLDIKDSTIFSYGYINASDGGIASGATVSYALATIPVTPNTQYVISSKKKVAGFYNNAIRFLDSEKKLIGFDSSLSNTYGSVFESYGGGYVDYSHTIKFTAPDKCYYIQIGSLVPVNDDLWKYAQLEKGSTATAYVPYRHNAHPIPQAILDLPGYGDSAGSVYNYVDFEEKKYHKRVESVDLGSLEWNRDIYSGKYLFNTPLIKTNKNATNFSLPAICSKLIVCSTDYNEMTNNMIALLGYTPTYSGAFVRCDNITVTTEFKQAMQGIMLYYELAEEEVTDISDIVDAMEWDSFEVEAGGTITLKQALGDDYRVPVPSTEQYVIKLSEVSSNE